MATVLWDLMARIVGDGRCKSLMTTVDVPAVLRQPEAPFASRAVIAQALNILLFDRLTSEVPEAARFAAESAGAAQILLDHGAVRTIDGDTGRLPSGYRAIGRLLEPLGFELSGEYPLDRLSMTGRSFTHVDAPEAVAQFFVSELHVGRLPREAQAAAEQVFSNSADPVSPAIGWLLDEVSGTGRLPIDSAARLLCGLLDCFGRQHAVPRLRDYDVLLQHSAELAWIATEGNRFNHSTARVPNVEKLATQLKLRGYMMKDRIEVSTGVSVRQTAVRAALVERRFMGDTGIVTRRVPGAFFEFITRDEIATPRGPRLDLRFDSSNAQGIFKMTAAARAAAA